MKNYKSILFIAASIITTSNNHITQTGSSFSSWWFSQPNYEDNLNQLRDNLRGIPQKDIDGIVCIAQNKLNTKNPTNDYRINQIMREAIISRVRINTHATASRLTNNQTVINNTVQSMSGNIKARLARGDNLNGQALAQFFGPSLERMVQQNVSQTQKEQIPKFAPSAPEEPEQENINECCVCFESSELKNIPCRNGTKHSTQICSTCISSIATCPICRSGLRK